MNLKILTIDDSRTIRSIVKKTFKPFDCEILEASNGVEGLAMAAKTMPALILLDVTMPVMDGIEMLTRLKSDAQLRHIPVIMLTAEGGREMVQKIVGLGVRGYVVKPFKEETMIGKVGQIVELRPTTEVPNKPRSIKDPATLLVVDDKTAIVQQLQAGLKATPWQVHGCDTPDAAMEFCRLTPPDLILASLSLPEGGAATLMRALRAAARTKFLPVFALAVRTDLAAQAQAQQIGFSAVITKPIDISELQLKVASALNLDTSAQYFSTEENILIVTLPENCTAPVLVDVANFLPSKISEAVDAGISRLIIQAQEVKSLHIGVIKLVVQAMQAAQGLAMQCALVGNPQVIADSKMFEETQHLDFHPTLPEAKVHLGVALAASST